MRRLSDERTFSDASLATDRQQWHLQIDAISGTEVKQNEICTSKGQLTTSGLYTCVGIGVQTQDQILLAHVDAGCCPSILAHWIDTTFASCEAVKVHLWNHMGADLPLFGHAAKVVDRALSMIRTPVAEIQDHGAVSMFEVVTLSPKAA